MAVIVVAEDDPDVHVLLEILLGAEGHDVRMARDGATALALAADSRAELALLDIAMPGELDGIAVTRALRADPRTAELPILLLNARTRDEDVRRGLAAGAHDYVLKPFDAEEMLERVRALLRGRGA